MPIYSYRCTACGNEFDVRQSFSDDPLKICENCGGALRKLFNSVGIVFKGSGFYHTDSKSNSSALHARSSATAATAATAVTPASADSASSPSSAESAPSADSSAVSPSAAESVTN